MVFDCERREADFIRNGILPFLRHEDLLSLRKREMLHQVCKRRAFG